MHNERSQYYGLAHKIRVSGKLLEQKAGSPSEEHEYTAAPLSPVNTATCLTSHPAP